MRTLTLATVVLLAAPAARADSLRCAGGIVSVGDATIDLLGKCGAPALRDGREGSTFVASRLGGASVRRTLTVAVERWTYDFGPDRFVMFVTLEAGKVTAVERGSYGYAKGGPDAVPIRKATCAPNEIHERDAKLDLLARCGEPAVVDVADETEVVVAATGPGVAEGTTKGRPVEIWTYDFGPQALVRFAFLRDGVVVRVETGRHGFAQSR